MGISPNQTLILYCRIEIDAEEEPPARMSPPQHKLQALPVPKLTPKRAPERIQSFASRSCTGFYRSICVSTFEP